MEIYWYLIAATVAGGLLVGVALYLILKQSYEAQIEATQKELSLIIASLEEKLTLAEKANEAQREMLEASEEALEQSKAHAAHLEQSNAVYLERIDGLDEKVSEYETLRERYRVLQEKYEEEKLALSTALSTARSSLEEHGHYLEELRADLKSTEGKHDSLQQELTLARSRISELEAMLENAQREGREKLALLEESKDRMRLEFKELASAILKNTSETFTQQNTQKLDAMIAPIREQFKAFEKQVNDVYVRETKERSVLQEEIRQIKELNMQLSKEANNLTNALRGESKTQGIWGEMILERVLENSGLREGEAYKREVSLEHHSDGSRFRPDVVVYLPDKREIIIDAKTSLRAYERYVSTTDEMEKEQYAKEHLAALRQHIRQLSDKDYTGLKGVETLDFIFMFVPVESALLMAMERDAALFDDAFKKNVILVGPTTLMVALRAVENTWKQEHRQRNAMEIARRAGLLYDKFAGFVESVEKLGKQINTVQGTYTEMHRKLRSGAGSVTRQFVQLKELGAAASKTLSEELEKAEELEKLE
jgi:DNA recombination protein RmuC